MNQNLEEVTNVYGNQIGEYFGTSIATGDFNGDGYVHKLDQKIHLYT